MSWIDGAEWEDSAGLFRNKIAEWALHDCLVQVNDRIGIPLRSSIGAQISVEVERNIRNGVRIRVWAQTREAMTPAIFDSTSEGITLWL
jgi:hypothetical protein